MSHWTLPWKRSRRNWSVRVRRVGYVPVRHHNTDTPAEELDGLGDIPGYVPDPLFDEQTLKLPPGETHAFWFTVSPPRRRTAHV